MPTRFVQANGRTTVRHDLAGLERPVQLVLCTSAACREHSEVTRALLDGLVALHDRLSLEVLDLVADAALATELGIDKAPAIAVLGGEERADHGLRFYGLPSGYTFPALREAVFLVGGASVNKLQPATRVFLEDLRVPLRLQVFVTASSILCPKAVLLAYQLALASPHIVAEVVEVLAFPDLVARYGVKRVPTTVINERSHVEGAATEPQLLDYLRAALEAAV